MHCERFKAAYFVRIWLYSNRMASVAAAAVMFASTVVPHVHTCDACNAHLQQLYVSLRALWQQHLTYIIDVAIAILSSCYAIGR
jgi:hypothetical protein